MLTAWFSDNLPSARSVHKWTKSSSVWLFCATELLTWCWLTFLDDWSLLVGLRTCSVLEVGENYVWTFFWTDMLWCLSRIGCFTGICEAFICLLFLFLREFRQELSVFFCGSFGNILCILLFCDLCVPLLMYCVFSSLLFFPLFGTGVFYRCITEMYCSVAVGQQLSTTQQLAQFPRCQGGMGGE